MGAASEDISIRKSDLTRIRVMDSAAKVLRLRGYAGARLSEIADNAGLKPANIYYYFESRDALIEQVMEVGVQRGFEAVREAVEALGSEASPLDRLKSAIMAHLQSNLAQDDYASATIRCLGQVPDDMRERQLALERGFGHYWRMLIAECQADGSVRSELHASVVRMLLLGMLNWAVEWYEKGELSPEQVADQAVSLFVDGCRPRD